MRKSLHWTWETNYAHSDKGRIWVGWQHLDVDMTILASSDQFIHCIIKDRHGSNYLFFTLWSAYYRHKETYVE